MRPIREIELRSDTMTKPTPEMRQAMFTAVVGDDGHGEDPTVRDLELLTARMFEMEAARFFPSGVMGNLASVMSHCRERGQEAILGHLSHMHLFEQGGIAQIAGVHHRTVANEQNGTFDILELTRMIRPSFDYHQPKSSLICIENTHNCCSGAVLPLEFIQQVSRVAKNHNLPVHVDGARIFNAAVALDLPVSSLTRNCDTVSVCLSKGLACPMGNLVAGSKEFIERATRCRKALGGSMRQSGIMAAAGIVGLNNMVTRLADDHVHAKMIAQAIASSGSDVCSLVSTVQSNIIIVRVHENIGPIEFCERMKKVTARELENLADDDHPCSVRMMPFQGNVRMVTHADVSREQVHSAIAKLKFVMDEFEQNVSK